MSIVIGISSEENAHMIASSLLKAGHFKSIRVEYCAKDYGYRVYFYLKGTADAVEQSTLIQQRTVSDEQVWSNQHIEETG